MAEETAQQGSAGNLSQAHSANEQVTCVSCGSEKVHRVFREGLLQEKVYPCFGYYPWRCTACGHLRLFRKRHRVKTPQGEAGR